MRKYLMVIVCTAVVLGARGADIVARWNFNGVPPDGSTTSGSTNTSFGSGSLRMIGGTTYAFAGGHTNDPTAAADNSAINVSTYPGTSVSNKSAGIRFMVSTVDYTNITISWAQRESATASRFHRLQYTINGTDFIDMPTGFAIVYTNNVAATLVFTNQSVDLSGIAGIADNPDFAFQILSEFEGPAGAYVAAANGSTYSPNGTVRFEMMTISGTPVRTPNNPPAISAITNVAMRADTFYPAISFTIGDSETAAGSLILDKSSTDTTLLPLSGIILGGTESNRTVSLVPAPNRTGSATVTLTVIDGGGKSNSTIFAVNVIPTNTGPTIGVVLNQGTTVSTPVGPVLFTIGDAETGASNLTVTAVSLNTTLLPQAGVELGGSGANRTITLTPSVSQLGNGVVSLTVSDGVFTTNRTFVFSVLPSPGTLFVEPFSYPDGPLVNNSFGLWQTHGGTNGELDTVGQILYVTSENAEDVNARLRGEPYTPASSTNLYYSFRFSVYTLPTVLGDYFAHFKDNGNNFRARLFLSTTNAPLGYYRIGVANGAAFPTNAGYAEVPTDVTFDQTNLIVVRYNVGTGVSTLWFNPTSVSDPSYTASDLIGSTNNVTQFAIRESRFQGDLFLDDVRVATTFGEALGILPSPSVPLKVFRTGTDVVISWPTSASGFVLQSNPDLNTTNWQNVAQAPVVVGSDNVVTIGAAGGSAFFRLKN